MEIVTVFPGGRHYVMGPTTVTANSTEITVPDGKVWLVKYVYVTYRTSATVGTRYFTTRFVSGSSLKYPPTNTSVTASQRASQNFESGGVSTNANRLGIDGSVNNSCINELLPTHFMLFGGEKIKIYDTANVDATGDSIVYVVGISEFPYR